MTSTYLSEYLSGMSSALASGLGNHLWQSTLFAAAAGLLTLTLRKNQARARYGLWLAASLKFLIPFSLLVSLGSRLAWSRTAAGTGAGFYFAMEEVGQPFTQPVMSMISPGAPSTVSASLLHLLPALAIAAWMCGFAAGVSGAGSFRNWNRRWRCNAGTDLAGGDFRTSRRCPPESHSGA